MDDSVESKNMQNPPRKANKCSTATQICMRFFATAASLAAAWIMFTSKETTEVYGLVLDARYSYSPPFKFFAIANLVACVSSAVALFVALIVARNRSNPDYYFYMFLHDLVMMTLVIAACAGATAFGLVGKYGNSHTGWMPICDHFATFCNRVTLSMLLSYIGFIFYLLLTIISANKSRRIQV